MNYFKKLINEIKRGLGPSSIALTHLLRCRSVIANDICRLQDEAELFEFGDRSSSSGFLIFRELLSGFVEANDVVIKIPTKKSNAALTKEAKRLYSCGVVDLIPDSNFDGIKVSITYRMLYILQKWVFNREP